MKNLASIIGLVALCLIKATLVSSIWIMVISALALTGAARLASVWRNRSPG